GSGPVRPTAVRPVSRPRTLADPVSQSPQHKTRRGRSKAEAIGAHHRHTRECPREVRMTQRRRTRTSIPPNTSPRRAPRPEVSVVIVNWNCRSLLRACLHSLRAKRQGVRFEVVVVDNGSTDGAADLVARLFPRVKLIRNADNRGFARANNQAARAARGRYLFF